MMRMMRIASTVTDGMMGNNGLSPFQTFCQHLLQLGSHPGQSAVKTITNKIDFADEEGKSKVSVYDSNLCERVRRGHFYINYNNC